MEIMLKREVMNQENDDRTEDVKKRMEQWTQVQKKRSKWL